MSCTNDGNGRRVSVAWGCVVLCLIALYGCKKNETEAFGMTMSDCKESCAMVKTCDAFADVAEIELYADCDRLCELDMDLIGCMYDHSSAACRKATTTYYDCSQNLTCDDYKAAIGDADDEVPALCRPEMDTYLNVCDNESGDAGIMASCDKEWQALYEYMEGFIAEESTDTGPDDDPDAGR